MPKHEAIREQQGVVASVFESFVEALRANTTLDPKIAERFKSALSKNPELSVDAVRRALFFEEPLA
jgi:hypothetical protein